MGVVLWKNCSRLHAGLRTMLETLNTGMGGWLKFWLLTLHRDFTFLSYFSKTVLHIRMWFHFRYGPNSYED